MVDSLLVVLLQLDGDFAATINTLYIDTNLCTHILYNRPFVSTVKQVPGNLFFLCVLKNNLCFIFIHGRIAHHKICVCENAQASELDHACMKVWICVSPCFSVINHAIWWLFHVFYAHFEHSFALHTIHACISSNVFRLWVYKCIHLACLRICRHMAVHHGLPHPSMHCGFGPWGLVGMMTIFYRKPTKYRVIERYA